ncbi:MULTISPECIES: hypothetical protein [unclassified Bradyrhizobium]|uniref:hypothetical protein n=1 Tax=unclassified Bradyrhizobium TaxID=2631580 RepID=UPI00291685BB|nr:MULTISPECIES: hypothetical protein [unclassified Bradyrhizobium]
MADTFEAFFAVKAGGPLGPTSYRAGYRYCDTGDVVCALELPASIVETAMLRDANLAFTLAPDGHIRFSVLGFACEDMREGLPSVTEPIDKLIAQSVAVDSLRFEEVTPADLNSLLQRLHRSVTIVQEALKHLSDQRVQNPR